MTFTFRQLKPNVYHIHDPQGVFMTIIVGEKKALLFDTGYGIGNLRETISQITNLPLIIVNSHGHLDHILGNRFFNEAYLHPADLEIYRNHSTQVQKRSVLEMQLAHSEGFSEDFDTDAYLAEYKTIIQPVEDGNVFDLGGVELSVIHIPGHTPGGIALLDDRDRLLLTGDMVSPHVWMFLQESTNITTYIQSLQKLQKLNNQFDGIIASHVPVLLQNDIISRLIHCATNIDPEKSVPFEPIFKDAGKGLMYFEGIESLKKSLALDTLDFKIKPFHTLDLGTLDFSKVNFVSIVYDSAKL